MEKRTVCETCKTVKVETESTGLNLRRLEQETTGIGEPCKFCKDWVEEPFNFRVE
jgi:hypothetical protein